jgi:hypothetical protein
MSGLPIDVRFAHPDAGYDAAQENARRAGLVRGKVYTIRSMQVGQSSTTVELYEVRGRFDSVFFEPAVPGEPRLSDADLRVIARLADQSLRDSDYMLPFPPEEEELRLKHRKATERVQRKIRSIREFRKQP